MTSIILLIIAVLVASGYSVYLTVKLNKLTQKLTRPDRLLDFARIGIKHAEQLGGSSLEKLHHAASAIRKLDAGDGVIDFSDAQIRIAIQAVLKEQK